MNELPRSAGIDRTLARMMTVLDVAPGFDARLGARLARERPAPDEATRARVRERALAERRATEAALRRQLMRGVAIVALTTTGALLPAWWLGPAIGRALAQLWSGAGPLWIAAFSVAVLAAALWSTLERSPPEAGRFGSYA